MDIFEYLPQLIVAYDGNDEFANLIHVKKSDKDKDYYCPCCGGVVKSRALDSTKEQSHYYHKTGKCTKESQLHFFCKNWLFETGSKFYLGDELFEVASVDIEKSHHTPFGDYKPDVTVYTTNDKMVYFEMFFTNRKTGDDYFCKWDFLGNDVIEVNIKEYMVKTDVDTIPTFAFLYHDGICYSKEYKQRDLYANTIARIKHELTRQKVLNYKARIEQLDWFWQKIRNGETRESILETISLMEYEDMLSCYDIIKRKQCVSYLKNDVLNMINQKVIETVRLTLDLPSDENIYFDLEHIKGRTYEAGIRLNLNTEHITYNRLFSPCGYWYSFDRLSGFPKIVFTKNIMDVNELIIPENKLNNLKIAVNSAEKFKDKLLDYEEKLSDFEADKYKVRLVNNAYTVLEKTEIGNYKVIFENYDIKDLSIDKLKSEIDKRIRYMENKNFLDGLFASDEYNLFSSKMQNYKDMGLNFNICITENELQLKVSMGSLSIYTENFTATINDFAEKANTCVSFIKKYMESYSIVVDFVNRINNCKNNFWKAELLFNHYSGCPEIKIDQKLFEVKKNYLLTCEKIYLNELSELNEENIKCLIYNAMELVLENMQRCGYRVMEVRE